MLFAIQEGSCEEALDVASELLTRCQEDGILGHGLDWLVACSLAQASLGRMQEVGERLADALVIASAFLFR
ncbi:MAG: hypothetical protein GY811_05345 [Myxococcales bacterium]|nr:hypothetical protein [Myxococcales bacterium]